MRMLMLMRMSRRELKRIAVPLLRRKLRRISVVWVRRRKRKLLRGVSSCRKRIHSHSGHHVGPAPSSSSSSSSSILPVGRGEGCMGVVPLQDTSENAVKKRLIVEVELLSRV
jgi:hypothetical protein